MYLATPTNSIAMKKIVSILLVAGGIYLGYEGVTQLQNSSASLKVGKLELSAKNETSATTAYIYLGFGVLLVIGGVYVLRKS
tara:strand:- start:11380 stop:11625 length:246 start_codon:yes stop_codon:yes gene_type:complete